jgi:hypothetical protein
MFKAMFHYRLKHFYIAASYYRKQPVSSMWGKTCDLTIVDEIAAPDMLLKYSLHEPRRGHADIKACRTDFRKAFPDLYFWGTADLIAEGDHRSHAARLPAECLMGPAWRRR